MKNKTSILALSTLTGYGLLKLPQSKIDPYTRATIGGITGGTLFLTGVIYKNSFMKWAGIGIMVGSILTLEEIARINGAKVISNEYSKPVFTLHETEGVKELLPNEIPVYRMDGLTIQGMNGVYKAHDGIYLKILADGTIQPTFGIGRIVNTIGAGFKPKAWVDLQTSKGDSRWAALYEKSV